MFSQISFKQNGDSIKAASNQRQNDSPTGGISWWTARPMISPMAQVNTASEMKAYA